MDTIRKQSKNQLIRNARSHRITLVLGAGISRSRQIPTWQDLTERMWQQFRSEESLPWTISSEDRQQFESIQKELKQSSDPKRRELAGRLQLSAASSPNSLGFQMAFEVLRERIQSPLSDKPDRFAESLRELIYANVITEQSPADPPDTLAALATLIKQEQASERSRILRVITFNVDDLLEREVHRGISNWKKTPVLWPITRPSSHIRSDGGHASRPPLPCYHLHGYLPHKFEWHEDAPESLVFTDSQYWASVASPLSFANKIMSHALHDSHCVFIGLSMTDINLIRWLGTRFNEVSDDKRKLFSKKNSSSDDLRSTINDLIQQGLDGDEIVNHLQQQQQQQEQLESDLRKSQQKSLSRHIWIRTRNDDSLLIDFLRLRGVYSLVLPNWNQLQDVLKECFPE